jgi:hypothetical protein
MMIIIALVAIKKKQVKANISLNHHEYTEEVASEGEKRTSETPSPSSSVGRAPDS